ncbi:MAG: HAD family hydrolase [Spirochaetota bacterium]
MKALFLDRDGVINIDTGYVVKIKDFYFIEEIFSICKFFTAKGFKIFVVTNQAGIARGYYTEKQFHQLTQWMLEKFLEKNINIEKVYYCPYHEKGQVAQYKKKSEFRKPAPGMLLNAQKEFGVDFERSVLIGDKSSDIQAGQAAGVKNTFLISSKTDNSLTEYSFSCHRKLLSFLEKETLIF